MLAPASNGFSKVVKTTDQRSATASTSKDYSTVFLSYTALGWFKVLILVKPSSVEPDRRPGDQLA